MPILVKSDIASSPPGEWATEQARQVKSFCLKPFLHTQRLQWVPTFTLNPPVRRGILALFALEKQRMQAPHETRKRVEAYPLKGGNLRQQGEQGLASISILGIQLAHTQHRKVER